MPLESGSKYKIIEEIGEGTFGHVYRAVRIEDSAVVVLKKILIRRAEHGLPKAVLREIHAYQQIQHDHVLGLFETYATPSSVVLVLESMHSDLHQFLRKLIRPLTEGEIKCIMRMLLSGLAAIHRSKIIHRDIKPSNILFDDRGYVKIGDMGLARIHTDDGRSYSHQVATRFYRAPELLYGSRHYDYGVDLWAVGCVFGEMLGHGPVFPGQTDIDQLYQVVRVLGTPSNEKWPGVENLPDYDKIRFCSVSPMPFRQLLPDASEQALDLLQQFLTYDSSKRIPAIEALEHDYFFSEPYPVRPEHLLHLTDHWNHSLPSLGG